MIRLLLAVVLLISPACFAEWELLPVSIQETIINYNRQKRVKTQKITIRPDFVNMFKYYIIDEPKDIYWWNRYRLTIYF